MKILITLSAILGILLSINLFAKDISKKELENLAEQYGGVYVFDRKLEKEIITRETQRKEMIKSLKGKDLGNGLYAVDTSPVNKQLPQVLSNGLKYYTTTREYGNDYKKKAEIPQEFKDKIINFIRVESYNNRTPAIHPKYFYADKNGKIIPIVMYVSYSKLTTSYGLFGDEGRGFSFSRQRSETITTDNKFYYNGTTFIKENSNEQ